MPVDHSYARARDRGNRGQGIAVGLIDADLGFHATRMRARISRIVPDVTIYTGSAQTGPSEIRRLAEAGCPILILPFVLSNVTRPEQIPQWTEQIDWAVGNGVLVFAGVGNGVEDTMLPAAHPAVIACAAIRSDGSLDPQGSSRKGRIDAVAVGDERSSGATADCGAMAVQWLSSGGMYLFGNSKFRVPGYRYWLWLTGISTPRGIAPDCSSL